MARNSSPNNPENWSMAGFPADQYDTETPYSYTWIGEGPSPAGQSSIETPYNGPKPWNTTFCSRRTFDNVD